MNYGNYKNRLGAYHAPKHTFLDFGFLRTLPTAQIRNGFAELIKISSCAHLPTFDLLDKYAEKLIATAFGHSDDAEQEVKEASDRINRAGIHEMLKLESPNLHEIGLDRVIAYGHTYVLTSRHSCNFKINLPFTDGPPFTSSPPRFPFVTATPSPSTWPTRPPSPTCTATCPRRR